MGMEEPQKKAGEQTLTTAYGGIVWPSQRSAGELTLFCVDKGELTDRPISTALNWTTAKSK